MPRRPTLSNRPLVVNELAAKPGDRMAWVCRAVALVMAIAFGSALAWGQAADDSQSQTSPQTAEGAETQAAAEATLSAELGGFGLACPASEELLRLNDLLFSGGFQCSALDQTYHAAYDRWPSPTGPAPIRQEPAAIAATIKRLRAADAVTEAQLQLGLLPPGSLREAVENAVRLDEVGTTAALFVADDVLAEGFRAGNGFDWATARELMLSVGNAEQKALAQRVYRSIVLGAALGAAERESEPQASTGWTNIPLWSQATRAELEDLLIALDQELVQWGDNSVLYLRVGVGLIGLDLPQGVDQSLDQGGACRPQPSWPSAARRAWQAIVELDQTCADVSQLALRDWQAVSTRGVRVPAWPLD